MDTAQLLLTEWYRQISPNPNFSSDILTKPVYPAGRWHCRIRFPKNKRQIVEKTAAEKQAFFLSSSPVSYAAGGSLSCRQNWQSVLLFPAPPSLTTMRRKRKLQITGYIKLLAQCKWPPGTGLSLPFRFRLLLDGASLGMEHATDDTCL